MPAIRCITFDWGDTLAANHGMPHVSVQRTAFARLGEDLVAAGGSLPAGWFDQAMRELAQSWHDSVDRTTNPDQREFDFAALIDTWVGRAGAIEADPHAVRLALDRCLNSITDTVLAYAESVPALSLLKARGYRIGILSHVAWPGPACRSWFARHGLAPYIDFYSLSCDVGWIKPNPRHFRHALDLAGCPANEVLHVGDHPLRDIGGAKAMGMRTCLRVTEGVYQAEELDACRPDARIVSLHQLLDILAAMGRGA
ncbi:MAG: HAD family hydrolase [Planctomycetes bacterium]|nr:HAD family hydrolase [Planctomycetota bacterium]